eukprot:scaffold244364_cov38-Prasinocladus_malaysianus.AAC.2
MRTVRSKARAVGQHPTITTRPQAGAAISGAAIAPTAVPTANTPHPHPHQWCTTPQLPAVGRQPLPAALDRSLMALAPTPPTPPTSAASGSSSRDIQASSLPFRALKQQEFDGKVADNGKHKSSLDCYSNKSLPDLLPDRW